MTADVAAAAPSQAGAAAPVFDLEELRQVVGSLDENGRHFLHQFIRSTKPIVTDIGKAIAARDRERGRRSIHTAKGAARTIMALELAQLFADLEQCIMSEDWVGAQAGYAAIGPAWTRAEEFVAKV